jgi:hypothetical protein
MTCDENSLPAGPAAARHHGLRGHPQASLAPRAAVATSHTNIRKSQESRPPIGGHRIQAHYRRQGPLGQSSQVIPRGSASVHSHPREDLFGDRKLEQYRRAHIANLILCIDERRNCADADLPPGALVVRFRRRLDPAAILRVLG